ncbi:MAG: citrate/2-methylcitrate synthase [Desulfobacterales bacterium]
MSDRFNTGGKTMEEECKITLNTGLRGVTIANTRICEVDGKRGRLIYRGYLIQDLANASYEEVVHLLLYEHLPTIDELKAFRSTLAAERGIPPEVVAALRTRPATAHPMDILQAAVPLLAHHDPDLSNTSREAALRMAQRLIARFPTVLAAWHRIRGGKDPVAPSREFGHAANFLYMLNGQAPDDTAARAIDTALVLHAEHAFNASTFAAREVASTQAHMYAAVAAGVGSLSGALHGGANAKVMQMLLKLGSTDKVADFVNAELDAGRKIFGLGHAVYDVDDPRAHILAPMSKALGELAGNPRWYEMSTLIEKTAKEIFRRRKNADIPVNVDFYSASLYYYLGIPVDLFTPVFAIARVAGWAAHIIEEQFAGAAPKPVLYRPESEYVGDYCGPDVCEFTPIEQRKST